MQPFENLMAPDACTLPTAEQPLRVTEFGDLFAEADGVRRSDPTRMEVWFPRRPGLKERADDLARRESGCCSFFAFSVTEDDDRLRMAIAVPDNQVAVLDGLAALAGTGPVDVELDSRPRG